MILHVKNKVPIEKFTQQYSANSKSRNCPNKCNPETLPKNRYRFSALTDLPESSQSLTFWKVLHHVFGNSLSKKQIILCSATNYFTLKITTTLSGRNLQNRKANSKPARGLGGRLGTNDLSGRASLSELSLSKSCGSKSANSVSVSSEAEKKNLHNIKMCLKSVHSCTHPENDAVF